ncbi:hypothetical protein HYT24_00560 [Candidatus Pacearchaeota archaeon]|nr:hypothetical protein [Candidatus Pacearchaeota archaeon]
MTKQRLLEVSGLEIRKSKIADNGIFANRSISKGQTILFLDGEEVSLKEIGRRIDQGIEKECDPLQVDDEIYI